MGQLSFFAADVCEPTVADLGGLLAAHGQVVTSAAGCRLSILLAEQWRAVAVEHEFARRDIDADVLQHDDTWLVRSGSSSALEPVAAAWTRGSVKAIPDFPSPPGGLLRCWAVAAGRPDDSGFVLGTDPHAEHTYPRLASGLAAVGLTGTVLGVRGGGPGVRIVGRRRLDRLSELLGDPPQGAPQGCFPEGR